MTNRHLIPSAHVMLRRRCLTTLLCFGLGLIGCSAEGYKLGGTVKLAGTLAQDGQPIHVEGLENATGMIVIGFCPLDAEGNGERIEVTTAGVNADGTFEVVDGIEPGKYAISVRAWEPYPQVDKLKGKFSPRKTKIIRDIDGDTVLDLEVANPEG